MKKPCCSKCWNEIPSSECSWARHNLTPISNRLNRRGNPRLYSTTVLSNNKLFKWKNSALQCVSSWVWEEAPFIIGIITGKLEWRKLTECFTDESGSPWGKHVQSDCPLFWTWCFGLKACKSCFGLENSGFPHGYVVWSRPSKLETMKKTCTKHSLNWNCLLFRSSFVELELCSTFFRCRLKHSTFTHA